MNDQAIRKTAELTAQSLAGAACSQPFGFDIEVYKAFGKIFLFCMQYQGQQIITLKCAPEYSAILRDIYPSIKPGYHMNKKHWITVYPHETIHAELVQNLVTDSYQLIKKSLPKNRRKQNNAEPPDR